MESEFAPSTQPFPTTLSVALKEWAVVQRSLLEGHQIVLLRKGGIVEETGDFNLKAPCALLFPTYEHETERLGDIQPCFESWLWEEEQRKPGRGKLRIEAAVTVTDVVRVEHRGPMIKLMPQHIWSRQFIDGRYDWEPYKPVFVLLVRAYVLAQPQIIDVLSTYGGCRSWIDLDEKFFTLDARPAISDDSYARRRELILKLLG